VWTLLVILPEDYYSNAWFRQVCRHLFDEIQWREPHADPIRRLRRPGRHAEHGTMRVAIIGASHWHLPLYLEPLLEVPGAKVVGVSDPSQGGRCGALPKARLCR
jgi:hypothetical protein